MGECSHKKRKSLLNHMILSKQYQSFSIKCLPFRAMRAPSPVG
jgi:hypothetical protein